MYRTNKETVAKIGVNGVCRTFRIFNKLSYVVPQAPVRMRRERLT